MEQYLIVCVESAVRLDSMHSFVLATRQQLYFGSDSFKGKFGQLYTRSFSVVHHFSVTV